MSTSSTSGTGYSGLQVALHWIVAVLIVAAWFYGEGMGRLLHQKMEGTYSGGTPVHVILGLAALAFVVIRLIVRATSTVPGPTPETSETMASARHWGHIALYVLMVAVPLGGFAAWGLGIESVADIHPLAANLLLILAGIHAALAIYHQWGKKDGTLKRMTRPGA